MLECKAGAWDSTVFNDAEEAGNWGNQIESKQPFFLWNASLEILDVGPDNAGKMVLMLGTRVVARLGQDGYRRRLMMW